MTRIPLDDILEGLYRFRIRESKKPKTVLELYDLEIQKKTGPDDRRFKTMVKRSIEQDLRNKNFGARNGNVEKNAVVKNHGTKQRVQGVLGDCWQWESNGQCSTGHTCSFRRDINKRGKITQANTSPNSFMQKNERKSSRTRSPRATSPSGRMCRWLCKDYLKGTCNNSFCENGTLQNACSTRPRVVAGLGKVLIRTSSGWWTADKKGLKRMMTKVQWLWREKLARKRTCHRWMSRSTGETWEERW